MNEIEDLKNRKGRYGLVPPKAATNPFVEKRIISSEVYIRLYEWRKTQPPEIQALFDEHMEDPTEESINELISLLRDRGIIPSEPKPKGKSIPSDHKFKSLRVRIIEALQKNGPMHYRSFFTLGVETPSLYPEAAVRQALRALEKRGAITIHEDIVTLK